MKPKRYILKSFAPGSKKNNAKGFSNLLNLSKIGLDWNTSLIKNSLGVGANETQIANMQNEYGIEYSDNLLQKAMDITIVNNEYIAFFDKSYQLRREYLRSFALNGEINFVLDTIADEAIVLDENNYFAYPNINILS